jgi:predicted GIY-YIG superfamily endonuclease
MEHCCYILYNHVNNKTYVGYTNNIDRRIRQHNGEIKGGARFTSNHVNQGVAWIYLMVISSPTLTKNEALSLEWHIKHNKLNKQNKHKLAFTGDSCEKKFMVVNDELSSIKFCHHMYTVHVQPCFLSKAREFLKGNNVIIDIL